MALQRLVHDEVLSVLSAAMLSTGRPSAALRDEARRAMTALALPEAAPDDDGVPDADATAAIAAGLRRIDPDARFELQPGSGTLPGHVVRTMASAASEALRNSLRHAGPQATRAVRIATDPAGIEIRIGDDGVGFDPSAGTHRLGIATSIVGRMDDLGGTAQLNSAPGRGAEVVLAWQR